MKQIKKLKILKKAPWLAAIALGFGFACASSGFAVGAENNKATATKPSVVDDTKKNTPSFLFVIQAKQGHFETKAGKTYLVLNKAAMKHVVEYDKKTYQIIKYDFKSFFSSKWDEVSRSFNKDPRYAFITADPKFDHDKNLDNMIIYSMSTRGDAWVFEIKQLDKESHQKKIMNPILAIDINKWALGYSFSWIATQMNDNKLKLDKKSVKEISRHMALVSCVVTRTIENKNGDIKNCSSFVKHESPKLEKLLNYLQVILKEKAKESRDNIKSKQKK